MRENIFKIYHQESFTNIREKCENNNITEYYKHWNFNIISQ